MIDRALVARVRSDVAVGVDPSTLLAVYADPERRALLRERVRSALNDDASDADVEAISAELFGFGPLQRFLDDPEVTDVLVNAADEVYVERDGRLHRVEAAFRSSDEVGELAHRIAASVGRELTLERPFVDARMRDGSRANAIIAPIGGPSLSIRKFRRVTIPLSGPAPSWTDCGLHADAAALLLACVRARATIVVSGATSSGKSTLLRSLAAGIPEEERLIVIEDTNELDLSHPHVVHLECVPGRDGNAVGVADLVVNALRMRPDRIIIGEVRSPREASAFLEALTTGHEGSLTTLHAGSAAGSLDRLGLLLARAGELAAAAVARHLALSLDLVVHVVRLPDGRRAIREIASVDGTSIVPLWKLGDATVRMPTLLTARL